MKIYTRQGDQGRTMVIGGTIDKDDIRIEAYGTIDELNSSIGYAVSKMTEEQFEGQFNDVRDLLLAIQHELFDCGTDLARVNQGKKPYNITAAMVEQLEQWIDQYDETVSPIAFFILPGGSSLSAALHMSRTICRRAERRVVTLASQQSINEDIKRYVNRLSDLLFVLARVANARLQVPDVAYKNRANDVRSDESP